MKQFEEIASKLSNYFHQVEIGDSVGPGTAIILKVQIPNVPEDLLQFYNWGNGIKVGLRDHVVGEILSAERLLQLYPISIYESYITRLLPIRSDGCGNYDCIVTKPGIGEGAIVFWGHEAPEAPAYLLASSLRCYLEMWSDHLVTCYFPNGEIDPRYVPPRLDRWPWLGEPEMQHPWPFDKEWISEQDPGARKLFLSSEIRQWLQE
jgi:hypothetical protein